MNLSTRTEMLNSMLNNTNELNMSRSLFDFFSKLKLGFGNYLKVRQLFSYLGPFRDLRNCTDARMSGFDKNFVLYIGGKLHKCKHINWSYK